MKKRIGIIGTSGYTGLELIKILSKHRGVEVVIANSETCTGYIHDSFPDYHGPLQFTRYSLEEISALNPDLIFCTRETGHTESILQDLSCRIIDLSAGLRFRNGSIYGLSELYHNAIQGAHIVANPGCYATAAILSIVPIINLMSVKHVVLDCKSGFSGAGRTPSDLNDPAHYNENIIAYRITQHQHVKEIRSCLSEIAQPISLSFTPHVIPVFRGILCTSHILLNEPLSSATVIEIYKGFYKDAPFVKILGRQIPGLHDVQGTNVCHIGGFEIDDTGRLVLVTTLDNLIKGASGQAVQNMNLMLGFPETAALTP